MKRCEALLVCRAYEGDGRCEEKGTHYVNGRWLCWTHHYALLHPEPRTHCPMQFVPQKDTR